MEKRGWQPLTRNIEQGKSPMLCDSTIIGKLFWPQKKICSKGNAEILFKHNKSSNQETNKLIMQIK